MNAEVVFDIEMDELVQWLAEKHKLDSLLSNEWIALKPRVVDGFFEMKVLASNEVHPSKWADYDNIQTEWEEECDLVSKHAPIASIVFIKDGELVSLNTRILPYAQDDFIKLAKENGATEKEANEALEVGKFQNNEVQIFFKKTV